MIPKYRSTLYTGRILQCYIVFSLVSLIILLLFYAMFLMMAVSLNRNARLQQENHFLSLQQERYENLCMAIEEARQARHDIRHHFVQLSSLAEQGDMEKLKNISPLQSAKSLTITCISVKIRLLTVFSDIIPPLPRERTFLFMQWFPCLLIFP